MLGKVLMLFKCLHLLYKIYFWAVIPLLQLTPWHLLFVFYGLVVFSVFVSTRISLKVGLLWCLVILKTGFTLIIVYFSFTNGCLMELWTVNENCISWKIYRWCRSSYGPTCFFILSRGSLISFNASTFTRWQDAQVQNFLHSLIYISAFLFCVSAHVYVYESHWVLRVQMPNSVICSRKSHERAWTCSSGQCNIYLA